MCGVNGGQENHRDVWGWGGMEPHRDVWGWGGMETHRDVWGEWEHCAPQGCVGLMSPIPYMCPHSL